MKPTVGHIVLYLAPSERDLQAAIITKVLGEHLVNLYVFGTSTTHGNHKVDAVTHSMIPAVGCWMWPPRSE